MTHKHVDLGYEIKEPIVHTIVVAIHNQALHALDKDFNTLFSYNCVTGEGDPKHETPIGKYHVDKRAYNLEIAKNYKSRTYVGAHMPYPMFLTGDGVAIHGSGLIDINKSGLTMNTHIIPLESYVKRFSSSSIEGKLGSHGCIRLSVDSALELYLHTPQGTPVIVRKFWIDDKKE